MVGSPAMDWSPLLPLWIKLARWATASLMWPSCFRPSPDRILRTSTSAARPVEDYLSEIDREVKGLKIGVPKEWFGSGLDGQIEQSLQAAIKKLEELGCSVCEVSMPQTEYAISTYYIIAPAEASSNLARYDGVKYGHRSVDQKDLDSMFKSTRSEGFGEEVKRRIMIGTYVLSAGYYDAYFLKASKVRTLLRNDYLEAFKKVDFLVGPTTPSLPFKIGEKKTDPLQMYLMDIYTVDSQSCRYPRSVPALRFQPGRPSHRFANPGPLFSRSPALESSSYSGTGTGR